MNVKRFKSLLNNKKFFSNKFSFHSSAKRHASVSELASVVQKRLSKNSKLPEIIDEVWKDPKVTQQCPDLIIR